MWKYIVRRLALGALTVLVITFVIYGLLWLLPEIPLYQQVVVNSETTRLHGVQPNDLVWTFNMYDWYCTSGRCQA